MNRKVYVVSNSGKIREEEFKNDTDATNYAKQQSGISAVMCAIYQSSKTRAFFYENGNICDAARRRDLSNTVEEIILFNMGKETKHGQKAR